jgi:1,4-dihydroxy-2-naphthoyl-CoA hydrolase
MWLHESTLEGLNSMTSGNMLGHLDIQIIEIGNDYLVARMPVDHRTIQPLGILHGGASVALAESMGSFASVLMIDDISKRMPVGVCINANHLNSVSEGFVYAKVSPIKIGRQIHVWNIEITDDRKRVVCISRLTVMIVERRN